MATKDDIKELKKLKKNALRNYRMAMRELRPATARYWISAVIAAGMIGYCTAPKKVTTLPEAAFIEKPYRQPDSTVQHSEPAKDTIAIYKPKSIPEKKLLPKYNNSAVQTRPVVPADQYEKIEPTASSRTQIPPANMELFYFPVRNDTLSKIAKDVTGDMSNWPIIQRYNNIPNHIIEVNQPIRIPGHIALNKRRLYHGTLPNRVAIAGRNDSLEAIAKRELGSSAYANDIFALNRQLNSRFSNTIYSKQYVFLPE